MVVYPGAIANKKGRRKNEESTLGRVSLAIGEKKMGFIRVSITKEGGNYEKTECLGIAHVF